MKFVAISDTHGYHRQLQLPQGDIIIHAGDFCHYGSDEQVLDFLAWYAQTDFKHRLLVAGNHDFFAAEKNKLFRDAVPEGINYLENSGITLEGISFWGSPVQPDLIGWAFGTNRGQSMKYYWDLMPEKIDVLITHTPPYGILDKTSSGRSIGCEELAKKLVWLKPKVHIFGHVHASYGKKETPDTLHINASNINSSKGLVNKPIIFEL